VAEVQAQVDLLRNLTQQVRSTATAESIGSVTALLLARTAHVSCVVCCPCFAFVFQMLTTPTKLDAEVLEAASKLLQVRILVQRRSALN
jgi:hypothetical protein